MEHGAQQDAYRLLELERVRDLACVWIPRGGPGDLGWWKHHGGGGDGGGGGGAVKRRTEGKQRRADTMMKKRLGAELVEQELRGEPKPAAGPDGADCGAVHALRGGRRGGG